MMENRAEFLAITMGLAKVGITVALINTLTREKLLFSALQVAQPKIVIVSALSKANFLSCLEHFDASGVQEPNVWWFGQSKPASYLTYDPLLFLTSSAGWGCMCSG